METCPFMPSDELQSGSLQRRGNLWGQFQHQVHHSAGPGPLTRTFRGCGRGSRELGDGAGVPAGSC